MKDTVIFPVGPEILILLVRGMFSSALVVN